MSTQEASKMVGLGLPAAEPRRSDAPAAPVQDASASKAADAGASAGTLVGLGARPAAPAAAPLVGLGAKPTAPAAAPLVGLGAKPAAPASAPLVGLGAKPAAPAAAPLVGLGAKPAAPAAAPLVGLGGAKPAGLTGLGASAPAPAPAGLTGLGAKPAEAAPAPAAAPAPRKSGIAIDLTAAERIQKLLAGRGTPEAGLRIRVRGGGCTGLTYDMEFADEAKERDRVFEDHQVRIFVDPKSYIFLIGTVLTYSSGLLESGFKLENPNAKKSCGCGDSFSV